MLGVSKKFAVAVLVGASAVAAPTAQARDDLGSLFGTIGRIAAPVAVQKWNVKEINRGQAARLGSELGRSVRRIVPVSDCQGGDGYHVTRRIRNGQVGLPNGSISEGARCNQPFYR
ncbi:MAG: hypothetical protein H6868_00280 [Rhodospirillales bacterium]|nr:hypothetical protein [Rhodospirillales bacterium]